MFKTSLKKYDSEVYDLIEEEETRQRDNIELIASENFTSLAVRECLGSCLTNKYSEGRPDKRYYGGNEVIDKIEKLCERRALEAFELNPEEWAVNVQPYSGSIANFAVYNALLKPHDRIMGLDLPSGGHLTHGFQTVKRKISASSIYFESMPYRVNEEGWIDYDALERDVLLFLPKLIICGASAYPRDFDYPRLRRIADSVGAYLMADIAHISGLVVTGEMSSPFNYCDVVTSTTHKTLRGPRSAMIFIKKEDGLDRKVHESVFPSIQGGPHNHQIAALAVQLREVRSIEFHSYITEVKHNAQVLAEELTELGFSLSTGGTDNHLLLVSLRSFDISGSKMEKVCEACNISLNKNAIPGDKSALSPSGIRIGTPCMTSRGMTPNDFRLVALWLRRCVDICVRRQSSYGRKLRDFCQNLSEDSEIIDLRTEISRFTKNLPFY